MNRHCSSDCPFCARKLTYARQMRGKQVRCPGCQNRFGLPSGKEDTLDDEDFQEIVKSLKKTKASSASQHNE